MMERNGTLSPSSINNENIDLEQKSSSNKPSSMEAAHTFLVHLGLKLAAFPLLLLIGRTTNIPLYGISSISFTLFMNLALFMSRDAIRLSAIKTYPEVKTIPVLEDNYDKNKEWLGNSDKSVQSSINQAWFSALFAFPITCGLSIIWLKFPTNLDDIQPLDSLHPSTLSHSSAYLVALFITATSVFIECLCEPFFLILIIHQKMRKIALIEGCATCIKLCFSLIFHHLPYFVSSKTFLLIPLLANSSHPLVAFALGQFCFSLYTLSSLFYTYKITFRSSFSYISIKPSQINISKYIYSPLAYISATHWYLIFDHLKLAVLKLVQSEGERIVLSFLLTNEQKANVAIISNLSLIVIRLFFVKIEEMAKTQFTSIPRTSQHSKDFPLKEISEPSYPISPELHLLKSYLISQSAIGLLGYCLGPPFTAAVLYILYGQNLLNPEAITLLQSHCLLLFMFSINGILEAYFISRSCNVWLKRSQWASTFTSCINLISILCFHRIGCGALSLLYSGYLVCLCKYAFSLWFIVSEQKITHPMIYSSYETFVSIIKYFLAYPIWAVTSSLLFCRFVIIHTISNYVPYGGLNNYIKSSYIPNIDSNGLSSKVLLYILKYEVIVGIIALLLMFIANFFTLIYPFYKNSKLMTYKPKRK